MGRIEAKTLKNVAQFLPAATALEVGTGFGYSSWWIAAGMALGGSAKPWLTSLDSQSEGDLADQGKAFAEAGAERLRLTHIVRYIVGNSPEDVEACLDGRTLDIAFIDGDHRGNQPLLDYCALKGHMKKDALLLLHDIDPRYSVGKAVAAALEDGWSLVTLPTSCRLGACYKSVYAFDCFMSAFGDARRASAQQ